MKIEGSVLVDELRILKFRAYQLFRDISLLEQRIVAALELLPEDGPKNGGEKKPSTSQAVATGPVTTPSEENECKCPPRYRVAAVDKNHLNRTRCRMCGKEHNE